MKSPETTAMRSIATALAVAMLACGCAGIFELRKSHWTVPEVKSWYEDYRKNPRAWDGILYQGSSSKWHYFTARVIWVDNWATIQIRRDELTIADERPYPKPSSAGLGYYFVDPSRDFLKVRDYP